MTQFEKAALLFGNDGVLGEADAIVKYLMFISTIKEDYPTLKDPDYIAIDNVLERIGDEINHLLGDALDAINIAGLKISSDNMDKILEGLRSVIDTGEIETEEMIQEDTYETPQNPTMVNL